MLSNSLTTSVNFAISSSSMAAAISCHQKMWLLIDILSLHPKRGDNRDRKGGYISVCVLGGRGVDSDFIYEYVDTHKWIIVYESFCL
jgi:hypothetical protein